MIPIKNIEFKKPDDDLFSDTKSNRGENISHNGTFTNQFHLTANKKKMYSPLKHGLVRGGQSMIGGQEPVTKIINPQL